MQRIQYAKSKSDCIAKAEGTYDKKKKQDEKGAIILLYIIHLLHLLLTSHLSQNAFYGNSSLRMLQSESYSPRRELFAEARAFKQAK